MMRRLDKKMLEWALFLSQTAKKKGSNKETLKQRSCISVSQNSSYKNNYSGAFALLIIPGF